MILLLWLNISTLAPIRNFSYEFFVVQHILSFFGFIFALLIHLRATAPFSRFRVQTPITMFIIDRVIRYIRVLWNNVRGSRAQLEQLEGGVTKVRVSTRAIKKWVPAVSCCLVYRGFLRVNRIPQ